MNKKSFSVWLTSICGFLLFSGLGLAGCAPAVGAEGKPTLAASATLMAYPPPPTPTVRPRPTRADGKIDRFNDLFVTPLPDEKLRVGDITQINPVPTATSTPERYVIQNEYEGEGLDKKFVLWVQDAQTGSKMRIGDDRGSALFQTMNDRYLIWRGYYLCEGCTEPIFGLYAHAFDTNTEIVISDKIGGQGYAEIEGSWVLYIDIQDPLQIVSNLYAHNLVTGKDILITSDAFYPFGGQGVGSPDPRDYYLMRGDKIVWVTAKMENGLQIGLRFYDFNTQTTRTLNVPETTVPRRGWDIFGDLVIWGDKFWQGYDLKRDAYFTIPIIPPGWENVPIKDVGMVTAKDNTLYWSLTVDDKTHYFNAPIVPKGQGAQPAHIVPTPHRKPTGSPVPLTPVPFALPTAYP